MKKRSRVHRKGVLYTTPKTPTYFGHSLEFETTRQVGGNHRGIRILFWRKKARQIIFEFAGVFRSLFETYKIVV